MIVAARIARRPTRSPSGPQTRLPSGRMTKETAKTARLLSVDAVGLWLGKNAWPIWTAT
jgi:hypothetical protein